jgi:anti-sigma factor RsiW
MPGAHRLTCTRIVELLRGRAGAIPEGARRAAVERHLAECPSCAYWRETLLKAIALFGTAVDDKTPEPIRRRVEEML